MGRKTVLEHYRICEGNGSPLESNRTNGLIAYKAVDTRFGETVTIKKVPIEDVDPTARGQFEEQARAARVLDHVNIARVLGFGVEEGHFVFVTEYLDGETLDAWVGAHGPMPADAALRVGLQVVNALAAAGFHAVTHTSLQPSNLAIVPGEVAEGGWPFVKLMNFGIASSKPISDTGAIASVMPQFASPEQLQGGVSDFRSEIYSLGATMCFLLTGAMHSPESRLRQLKRFPKPIRNLLVHMLRENPDDRPQDPVVFAEAIREGLTSIARREEFARKFGIPIVPAFQKIRERSPVWLPRRGLAIAALVVMLTVLAGLLWPQSIRTFSRKKTAAEPIGVPIGVPEASSAPVAQQTAPAQINSPIPAPPVASSTEAAPPIVQQLPASSNVVRADQVPPASDEIAANDQSPEPPPPGAGPDESPTTIVESDSEKAPPTQNGDADAEAPSAKVEDQPAARSEEQSKLSEPADAKAPAKTKAAVSSKRRSTATSKRARIAQVPSYRSEEATSPLEPGTFRARVIGTTPNGNVILALPSGETAIAEPPRRRARRTLIERRERFAPPLQPFDPGFPPGD
ncbi:MAG: eukaryotic-like serine/threonine-protein kinase [Verrucomicrobiota bacterium]